MTELTRRRDPDQPDCWRILYGDVSVGTIMRRVGQQQSEQYAWEWRCGFYPGSNPGDMTNGTAATLDEARQKFEAAWQVFLAKRQRLIFRNGGTSVTGLPGNMLCGSEVNYCPLSNPTA